MRILLKDVAKWAVGGVRPPVALLSILLSGCALSGTQASSQGGWDKQTVGWIESAQILGVEAETEAKLDTGATTTSINAEILDQPENTTEAGGMIRFRFVDTDGTSQVFERPVTRWVRIKDGDGGFFRRPVVQMQVCIAGRWIEEEANLADRDQFDYAVLIGRNMLSKGALVINSDETRTAPTNCPEREGNNG
ncbi:MAG: ATP-dependent zinc protease [Elainellaceae cyanobacterium]